MWSNHEEWQRGGDAISVPEQAEIETLLATAKTLARESLEDGTAESLREFAWVTAQWLPRIPAKKVLAEAVKIKALVDVITRLTGLDRGKGSGDQDGSRGALAAILGARKGSLVGELVERRAEVRFEENGSPEQQSRG